MTTASSDWDTAHWNYYRPSGKKPEPKSEPFDWLAFCIWLQSEKTREMILREFEKKEQKENQ